MGSQEHNMVVLGQIVKHIPKKLIEKLKNKHKIQTRSFSATSHVIAMIFAQLSHALSLNDICDCLRFHKGYLAQIRDLFHRAGMVWLMRTRPGMLNLRKIYFGQYWAISRKSTLNSYPVVGTIRGCRGGSGERSTW